MQLAEIFTGNIAAGMDVPAPRTNVSQTRSYAGNAAKFGKILETTMSRAQNRPGRTQGVSARRSDPSDFCNDSSLQGPHKSPGERVVRPSVSDTQSRRKAENLNDDERPDTESNKRAGSVDMLEVLAQLTGLDRTALKEILAAALGISEETLSVQQGFAETAAELAEMLGLDTAQKDALVELMKLIEDAAGIRNMAEIDAGTGDGQSAGVIQVGIAPNAEGFSETMFSSASEISDQLRAAILRKLKEHVAKTDTDGGDRNEGVRDAVLNMLERVRFSRRNAVGEGTGNVSEPEQAGNEPLSGGIEASPGKAEVAEMTGTGGTNGSDALKEPVLQQDTGTMDDGETPEAGMLAVQQDNFGPDAARQTAAERTANHTVSVRQIISQITEKASATLAHDRSEMVIELKPESLGRLSLKVVTENGIVMAKFVAENFHVQRLLESNMQMLRESLEKQGIVVQDLSVSVRQDGKQARENGPQSRSLPGVRPKGTAPMAAARILDTPGIAEVPGTGDPWLWQGSTINLTA